MKPTPAVRVHSAVWLLGLTSGLTDVSSEMVVSVLPMYLVLHLRMNPLEYGAVDGLYNGAAVALLSLAAGIIADRARRHKELAGGGYALSALCKLLLLAGTSWSWIVGVVALDRAGKGARTAPRDALISFYSSEKTLAKSFAVHRALDAGGSLAGPLLAFFLLSRLPDAYGAVFAAASVFALLGAAVFWTFVRNPEGAAAADPKPAAPASARSLLQDGRLRALAGAGALLSFATISESFLYMALQQRGRVAPAFFPLFYTVTACASMLFSIPVGNLADARGRERVLLAGYGALGLLDLVLLRSSVLGKGAALGCLVLFGLSCAATDGVFMAMAGAAIPAERRTAGLALLAAAVGLGAFLSSLTFGWLWRAEGLSAAVAASALALAAALPLSARWLRPFDARSQETR